MPTYEIAILETIERAVEASVSFTKSLIVDRNAPGLFKKTTRRDAGAAKVVSAILSLQKVAVENGAHEAILSIMDDTDLNTRSYFFDRLAMAVAKVFRDDLPFDFGDSNENIDNELESPMIPPTSEHYNSQSSQANIIENYSMSQQYAYAGFDDEETQMAIVASLQEQEATKSQSKSNENINNNNNNNDNNIIDLIDDSSSSSPVITTTPKVTVTDIYGKHNFGKLIEICNNIGSNLDDIARKYSKKVDRIASGSPVPFLFVEENHSDQFKIDVHNFNNFQNMMAHSLAILLELNQLFSTHVEKLPLEPHEMMKQFSEFFFTTNGNQLSVFGRAILDVRPDLENQNMDVKGKSSKLINNLFAPFECVFPDYRQEITLDDVAKVKTLFESKFVEFIELLLAGKVSELLLDENRKASAGISLHIIFRHQLVLNLIDKLFAWVCVYV